MIQNTLKIGVLGLPDNIATNVRLQELKERNIDVNVIIFEWGNWKTHYKRLYRKIKASGLLSTIKRILTAIYNRFKCSKKDLMKERQEETLYGKAYYVNSFNSAECQEILKKESLDIILLMTDSLISRKTFSLAKLATLNAHPGWIPSYGGLGGLLFQIRDGFKPSVSVHIVDEGVDTGTVLLREYIELPFNLGETSFDFELYKFQARFFAKVIEMFEKGTVKPIDTFKEPSNMTRGMSYKEYKNIMNNVKNKP